MEEENNQGDDEGGYEGDKFWPAGLVTLLSDVLSVCLEKGDLKSSKVRGSFLRVVSFGWGGKGGGRLWWARK